MVSKYFYVHPGLGKIPILTNMFQMGWNHQPDSRWQWKIHHLSRCIPIEHGDFPASHVTFQGCATLQSHFPYALATIFSIVAFGSSNSTAFIAHPWEWMHIQLSCYKVTVPDLSCYFQRKYRVSHQRTQRGEGTLDQKLWAVTCFGSWKGRWEVTSVVLSIADVVNGCEKYEKLVGEWDHEVVS